MNTSTIEILNISDEQMTEVILVASQSGYGMDWDGVSHKLEIHEEPFAVARIVELINELGYMTSENRPEKHEIWLAVPAVYNPGEWRLSKQITGPRGGKSWQKVYGTPATGGNLQMFLTPGHYKETVWSNGWPRKSEFILNEDGTVDALD